MTMYKNYESAKINNPEIQIYTNGVGGFTTKANRVNNIPLQPCNPADHCMTVEKFLADGHKFVEGDLYLETDGIYTEVYGFCVGIMNDKYKGDNERYILRAAALEDKPKRMKVEYVKREFDSAWEAVKDFEDGKKLYTKRSHKDYILIDNAPDVLRFLYDLHEHIETEIDERQEFINFVELKCSELNADGEWSFACIAAELFDSGRVKLVEGE